jgi:hypothetical protein
MVSRWCLQDGGTSGIEQAGIMAQRLTDVGILRQFETPVRGPHGICRFITIIGLLRNVPIKGGAASTETYSWLVGPETKPYEFLGACLLPSIASVRMGKTEMVQCSLESHKADRDASSGQVELRLEFLSAGPPSVASVLFSVTVLVAG